MDFQYGRPGLMALDVVALTPTGLRCEQPASQITGEIRNPFVIPAGERYVDVTINRLYTRADSLLFQQIDPDAVYAPGDRIAVIEQWVIIPTNRMLGNVDLEATYPTGPDGEYENQQALDFRTNPGPYYESDQPEGVKTAVFVAIGRWRQGVAVTPPFGLSLLLTTQGGATNLPPQNTANMPIGP